MIRMVKLRPLPTSSRSIRHGWRAAHGFSLMEVLIALIVLSLGLLGAVGMQAASLASNKETRNFSVALDLSRDLADRMRGNYDVASKTLSSDNPYLMADITLTSSTTVNAATTNCITGTCTADQLAAWDVAEWQAKAKAALPSPRIVVCFDQEPFNTTTGNPQWACTGTGTQAVIKLAWTRNAGGNGGVMQASDTSVLPIVIVPLTSGYTDL